MEYKIQKIDCPRCGASLPDASVKFCEQCGGSVIITEIAQVREFDTPLIKKYLDSYARMPNPTGDAYKSTGFLYIKLKVFDKALNAFQKAIDFDAADPDLYFYSAIAMLGGRKPFLVPRAEIDKIEGLINAAREISQNPMYDLFFAFVRYDHHYRKFYNVKPSYSELLRSAKMEGARNSHIKELFDFINLSAPSEFLA